MTRKSLHDISARECVVLLYLRKNIDHHFCLTVIDACPLQTFKRFMCIHHCGRHSCLFPFHHTVMAS
ncbi:hypothetical protein [Pantoea stewartii]|uniref:hypothetical protein n=1 Tax=Pantoea stewartii TaxID=66269 RepID=UPI003B97F041